MRTIKINKLKFILLFVSLISLFILVKSTYADRRYVSDMLIIKLRSSKGLSYEVITALKTGASLEVLEESERYLRVRTNEGEEGWVDKQYISSDPPKSLIIAGLKKETNRLKERIEDLKNGRATTLDQLNSARRSHTENAEELGKAAANSREEASRLGSELAQMTEQYNALLDQSKNVVELTSQNEKLQMENIGLNNQVEDLDQKNKHLRNTWILRWFLAGGGVFFLGWITGKIPKKKKKYF